MIHTWYKLYILNLFAGDPMPLFHNLDKDMEGMNGHSIEMVVDRGRNVYLNIIRKDRANIINQHSASGIKVKCDWVIDD